MGPNPRQRPGRWTSLVAVVQAVLLVATLLAAPALVIAQDGQPDGASPSPAGDAMAPGPGPRMTARAPTRRTPIQGRTRRTGGRPGVTREGRPHPPVRPGKPSRSPTR